MRDISYYLRTFAKKKHETMVKNIPISQLVGNHGQIPDVPDNPRYITEREFDDCKRSLENSPELLDYKRLLVYPFKGKFVVLCGNQRLRAAKELGFGEMPCYVLPEATPAEKMREYIIRDNREYGRDDWDKLANEWDTEELSDWDVEIPNFDFGEDTDTKDTAKEKDSPRLEDEPFDDEEEETDAKAKPIILDILFPSDNDFEIPCLLKERMAGRLELPVTPWGANSRLTANVNTYHFYVDDYRFEALFKDPANLVASGCKKIVEPNCSLHDQTPIAFGLQQIYKKRWLARYMQEVGVDVYVDLNVAPKFAEYNTLGVPEGWDAFFTRGLTGQVESLKIDLETARRISGKQTPNLIVYGGGKEAEKFCQKNGLLYVTDFINAKKD